MEHREIFAGTPGNFFWSFGKFFVVLAVKFAPCYSVWRNCLENQGERPWKRPKNGSKMSIRF